MSRENFRKKYKPTKITVLNDMEDGVQKPVSNNNLPFHSLKEDGDYFFRLAPKHEESKAFIYPMSIHWLPVKDNDTGEFSRKAPIFSATQHGDDGMLCITDEYIKAVIRKANDETDTKEDFRDFMRHINGYKAGNKYVPGISKQTSFVCYAWALKSNGEFGELKRLDLKYNLKRKLDVTARFEAGGEVGEEPFTDIDEGIPIHIVIDSDQPVKADKYALNSMKKFSLNGLPVPDEELEKFEDIPSLEALYNNSYKYSDFEKSLSGLVYFDEKVGYGIFQDLDFQKTIKEIEAQFAGEGFDSTAKKRTNEDNLPDSLKTDDPDVIKAEISENEAMLKKMKRNELKNFIMEKELPIIVTNKKTVVQLRKEILVLLESENEEDNDDLGWDD